MLQANLRILTSDVGLNNYQSIPLQGKTRYKVANAIGFSNVFSIVAFTVDSDKPNAPIRRGATEQRIKAEMEWLSEIVISSATGVVYVNVAAVEKKSFGKGTLDSAGKIGTAGIVKNIVDLGSTLYSWYSPSKDEPEFEFSIGAKATKTTKVKVQGEVTLGSLAAQLGSVGAFRTDLDIGKNTYQELTAINDFKEAIPGAYKGISGAFKMLFR